MDKLCDYSESQESDSEMASHSPAQGDDKLANESLQEEA